MSTTPEKIIEYLRTIDQSYRDQRIVSETELRALVWFFEYGQNVFSQVGRDWVGCTFRQKETTCLLVVKARLNGTQEVVFVTDRTPIGCVRTFCKKWHADTLRWVPDQYA